MRIFVRHFHSFMPSVYVKDYPVFMAKSPFQDEWMSFSKSTELTYTITELGNNPLPISQENISLLELFTLQAYFGKDQRSTDINETRCTSFFKSPQSKAERYCFIKRYFNWAHKTIDPINWAGYGENVLTLFPQVLNYGAGNLILSCAQSTFLNGNKRILKQPFKMLCQHMDVRQAIAGIANVEILGNVWTWITNVSKNVHTSENVYTVSSFLC